ncbi:hypothetical protein AciX9_0941 [Granulicella tundricola MP5ACTX9]|uniref:Uncharacterized protein n=1 Tax=Granulicella tundricola (strain ATCC BAA-1859 / DSM 23138 / MP5ACTX9) TaxID=1198114 RepID=E8X1T9_GRATM|nr:hypothetical protein AciX9_0941 [Granulicella tundricola MP5ACTX9]
MDSGKSWLRVEVIVDWKLFLSMTLGALVLYLLG